jgi:hypothetical protein
MLQLAIGVVYIKPCEREDLLDVKTVVKIEINGRSEPLYIPVRDADLVNLKICGQMSETIEVIFRKTLLEEIFKVHDIDLGVRVNGLAFSKLLHVHSSCIKFIISDTFLKEIGLRLHIWRNCVELHLLQYVFELFLDIFAS